MKNDLVIEINVEGMLKKRFGYVLINFFGNKKMNISEFLSKNAQKRFLDISDIMDNRFTIRNTFLLNSLDYPDYKRHSNIKKVVEENLFVATHVFTLFILLEAYLSFFNNTSNIIDANEAQELTESGQRVLKVEDNYYSEREFLKYMITLYFDFLNIFVIHLPKVFWHKEKYYKPIYNKHFYRSMQYKFFAYVIATIYDDRNMLKRQSLLEKLLNSYSLTKYFDLNFEFFKLYHKDNLTYLDPNFSVFTNIYEFHLKFKNDAEEENAINDYLAKVKKLLNSEADYMLSKYNFF